MNWKNEDGKIRFMTDDGWYHFDFMTIAWIGLFFVLVCMGILLLALSYDVFTGGKVMQKVSAENYTYNLTDQEREEIMLSEICLNTSIYLDECELVVGKTTDNSTYGDAIK